MYHGRTKKIDGKLVKNVKSTLVTHSDWLKHHHVTTKT